jgi:transposase-like protein
MINSVLRVREKHYKIETEKDKTPQTVRWLDTGLHCTCPNYVFKGKACEHIRRIRITLGMRDLARPEDVSYDNIRECAYCNSTDIRAHSLRHNVSGDVQRYLCHNCGKKFSFAEKKREPEKALKIMDMYFKGGRYADISRILEAEGTPLSSKAVSVWVQKYKDGMQTRMDSLVKTLPKDGWDSKRFTWDVSETTIRARDDPVFLYSLLDDETKVWLTEDIWESPKNADKQEPLSVKAKNAKAFNEYQTTILHV